MNEELHLNLQYRLADEVSRYYPSLNREVVINKFKHLSYTQYRDLINMCHQDRLGALDAELSKLGVLRD